MTLQQGMNLMYQLLFYLGLALSLPLAQPGGERAAGNIILTSQERIRPCRHHPTYHLPRYKSCVNQTKPAVCGRLSLCLGEPDVQKHTLRNHNTYYIHIRGRLAGFLISWDT